MWGGGDLIELNIVQHNFVFYRNKFNQNVEYKTCLINIFIKAQQNQDWIRL